MIPKLSLREEDIKSSVGVLKQYSVKDTYMLHTHDFYEMFYISKGKAIHKINDENQMISRGSFVLIRPEDVHKYEFFNHFDFEIISIGFPVELFERVNDLLGLGVSHWLEPKLSPHIILEGYKLTDVEHKLNTILKKDSGEKREIYFKSILPYLLYQFIQGEELANPNNLLPIWITHLIEEMNNKENFIAGLPKLIELADMSQEHLTREFRRHLDVSPTEFINTKRLNYAVELLLSRQYEIIEICFMSGFNNLSHFYHVFQKQYNCSPKQFLEQYREE